MEDDMVKRWCFADGRLNYSELKIEMKQLNKLNIQLIKYCLPVGNMVYIIYSSGTSCKLNVHCFAKA